MGVFNGGPNQFDNIAPLATLIPLRLLTLPQNGPSNPLSSPPPPYQGGKGVPCKVPGPKERRTVALLRASFTQLSCCSEPSGLVRCLLNLHGDDNETRPS